MSDRMVFGSIQTPKQIFLSDSVAKPVWNKSVSGLIPDTPQDVLAGNVASIPEPSEFFPKPDELFPKREEVVSSGKEFVIGVIPKPKDIAEAGKELAGLDFDGKVQSFALLTIAPTIAITGLIVIGGIVLSGTMR